MANQDLPISQLVLATELNGEELLPFAKDNANGALLVSLLKTYIRDGLATQEAVNTKQNKLTAGYGIEITADNKIKSTLDVSLFKIVDTLPTENIETKIYLVADPAGKEGENEYIEYMYVNNQWEQIGKYTAKVDLSDYMKTADANSTFAKKTEIPDVSDFVVSSVVSALATQVSTLATQLQTAQTKLDTIPTIPPNDGKCYAMCNGAWVVIADSTESVVTVTNDSE